MQLGFENELWKLQRADYGGGPGYCDRRKKSTAAVPGQGRQIQEILQDTGKMRGGYGVWAGLKNA